MDWAAEAIQKFFFNHQPNGFWKVLADTISINNPSPFFGLICDYLEAKTFLEGNELAPNDFYLAGKLMQCPSWSKILTSKVRPSHICRWFWHVFSIYPNPKFEFYHRRNDKIDGRLVSAIEQNNMGLFEILLDLVDLNARSPNDSGMKPIHAAAKTGNIQALEKLLSLGVDIETEDIEGLTPVFYAVQSKSLAAFNYLRHKGANVKHVEKQGRSLFYWAASLGKIEMLDILIADGVDPNQVTILGRSALSKSAWNGTVEVLTHLLKIPGILIDIPDKRGRTALHNAVWGSAGGREGRKMGQNAKDSPECAKLLLDHGSNIEAVDNGKNTPLCIACSTYSPKSVRLLLTYNANISHQGGSGMTAYHQALIRGNIKCVQIMADAGVDILAIGKRLSPIQLSIKYLQVDSVKWLVSKGILPCREDVLYCLKISEPEMLELLLKFVEVDDIVTQTVNEGNLNCLDWVSLHYPFTSNDICVAIRRDKKTSEGILKRWEGEVTSEMLEAMIEAKIDTADYIHKAVPTGRILRLAIKQGNLHLALKILNTDPGLLNEKDSYSGNTALHIACISGMSDLIPKLISLADDPVNYITASNNKGLVPIVLAQVHKHLYIAEMLKDMTFQSESSQMLTQVKSLDYEFIHEPLSPHPYIENMPIGYWPNKTELKEITETPYMWVDSLISLSQMVSEIQNINVIGLDLEYHTFGHKKGCICLIQISTGAKDYIIDALTNRAEVGEVLKNIVEDEKVIKVLHGADSDLMWLQNDFDIHPVRIFDTARAYKISNSDSQLPSLAILLYVFFNLKIDKSFQVAEWRIRPLPAPMLEYARNDAHYLPELFNKLLNGLTPSQVATLNSQCNAMCLKSPKGRLDRLLIIPN